MPRRPPEVKRPQGYPLIPIDWEQVDEWLEYGCKGTEIAASLGISTDTLYNRTQSEKGVGFSEYALEKRAVGDKLLRELQFKSAKKGNITMQIWLGKQRLEQKENPGSLVVPQEFAELFAETMKAIADKQREIIDAQQIDLNNDDTIINRDN